MAAIAAADARPEHQPYFLRADALRERLLVRFAVDPLLARELDAVVRFVERDAAGFEVEREEVLRAVSLRAAPARVAAALPACLTASPAAFAADFTPLAAPLAALRAWSAAARASFACRVDAAFLPDAVDAVLCWLRFLVAAAFFAAAERSAFV